LKEVLKKFVNCEDFVKKPRWSKFLVQRIFL
jgi:hypothetical protein